MPGYLKWFIAIVVVALLTGGSVFLYQTVQKNAAEPKYQTATVVRQDLQQLVSVTGRVQPTTKVDLAFEVTGKTDLVLVEVGDTVTQGDSLITLDKTDLVLELANAQANLENEQARLTQLEAAKNSEQSLLEELQKGSRPEDIQIAQTKVTNAEKDVQSTEIKLANAISTADQDLENDYSAALDVLQDAIGDYDAALTFYTDEFFFTQGPNQGNLVYPTSSISLETDIKQQRSLNLNQINSFENLLNTLTLSSRDEIDQALVLIDEYLGDAIKYLNTLNTSLSLAVSLSDADRNAFQSSINTARLALTAEKTTVNSSIQAIDSQQISNTTAIDLAEANLLNAENALLLAKDELKLKQAGNTTETINAQQAKVDQAIANISAQDAKIRSAAAQINLIRDRLDDRILKSPLTGVITAVTIEAGEITSPNTPVISIISDGTLEIVANIPEVDIANIQLGNTAEITLDAYGSEELFEATIVEIDPAETIIEGVPTYSVTFQFTEEDDRIKSGMTANIDILTGESLNVLAIPARSILFSNGKRYVRVLNDEAILEQDVTVGLQSWDGLTEVITGLSEGQEVITFIENAEE